MLMNSSSEPNFVDTLEHRRFAEFCDACASYQYIGLCYGPPGVGKTLSARQYSRWDYLEGLDPYKVPEETLGSFKGACTVFYTTGVVNSPGQISSEIGRLRSRLKSLAREPLRRESADKLKQINIRDAKYVEEIFVTHDWLSGPAPKLKPAYAAVSERYIAKEKRIGDPTRLILVDEADRLKIVSLEQMRAIFDAGGIGLVLIGMPGIEKRMARYPQFYSRIGFVHEFRPLGATEMRKLLSKRWTPPGVNLPEMDSDAITSVIRITGGNFRLFERLLTQIERIAEINNLILISKEAVEVARESLVIGQA
jgi:DNA transposition AAA+ family ATPase